MTETERAKRIHALNFTANVWQARVDHALRGLAEAERARTAFLEREGPCSVG